MREPGRGLGQSQDPDADRGRRRRRPGRRAQPRCRRLPRQAVRLHRTSRAGPLAGPAQPVGAFGGMPRRSHHRPGTAAGQPRGAAGHADQEGVRRPGGTVHRGRRDRQRRGTAGTGVGRARRSVQQHGIGHGLTAAPQARQPAADRNGHRQRLPAARHLVTRRRRPIRLRLTLVYSGLFLLAGAVLLAVTYGLVAQSLDTSLASAISSPYGSYQAQALKICDSTAVSPVQVAGCKAKTQQSLKNLTEASAAFQRTQTLGHLLYYSLGALGVVAVVSAWLGWIVAGRALRPVHAITAAARAASEENLGERIALAGPDDELKELADTFDAMLGRLDAAFASQRRFVANASHELRTPLATERVLIDEALAHRGA